MFKNRKKSSTKVTEDFHNVLISSVLVNVGDSVKWHVSWTGGKLINTHSFGSANFQ